MRPSQTNRQTFLLSIVQLLCLAAGVALAVTSGSIDQPMTGWRGFSWLASMCFVFGWGAVLTEVLVKFLGSAVMKMAFVGVGISLVLWLLIFAFAVPWAWTWAFARSMHLILITAAAVIIPILARRRSA